MNPAFERQLGCRADGVIGQELAMLVCSEADADKRPELELALREAREWTMTLQHCAPEGGSRWLETRVTPVFDEAGTLAQFVAVQHDVTGRVNAEIEAEQRAGELNLLYEAARRIGGTLDTEQIYRTTYDLIAGIMDCDLFLVSDFDVNQGLIFFRYAILRGNVTDTTTMPGLPLSGDARRGTQSIVIYNGRSICLNDYRAYLVSSGYPYYVRFDGQTQEMGAAIAEEGLVPRSALIVPLILEGQVVGVLQALSFRANAYTTQDLQLLEAVASHLAGANNNALLFAHAQAELAERQRAQAAEREQRALAEALRDTAAVLSSTLDLPTVMQRLLEYVGRVVPHDACNIMIIQGDSARITYTLGYTAAANSFIRTHVYPLTLEFLDYMARTGQPSVVSDSAVYGEWIQLPEPPYVRSCLMTPLRIHNQVIGFLCLDSYTPHFFSEADQRRIQAIADQAAIALENANLYAQVQEHAVQLEERVVERTVELKRTAERMEAIINSSSDGIALVDLDGRLRSTNPAFSDLVGRSAKQVKGLSLWEVIFQESPHGLLDCLRRVATTRERERLELTWTRPDGVVFFTDAAFTWVPDSDPNAAMILISFRDISNRKKAETDLRQRLERERQLNELKARFTSMVSHEFRTPLAIMQASTDILKLYDQRLVPEKRREHIEKIQQQIQQLALMQEEVLKLSRAENIELTLRLEAVRLVDFCRELIEEYQSLAPHHRLAFISAGPDREVMLDLRLMRDAVVNLLSNGVKYSPEGSVITLEVDCQRDPIRIVVQDHGIGIPETDLTHIFEAFHRAANVEARQGTGLGLTIVKRAIEAHGGAIDVESQVGSGTTFTLRLPFAHS